MSKVIYKYEVLGGAGYTMLPKSAVILHVGEQDGLIFLWAEVDDSDITPTVEHSIGIVPTGVRMHQTQNRTYKFLGTVQMKSGLVFHIYDALLPST